jgi:hypothetical protein
VRRSRRSVLRGPEIGLPGPLRAAAGSMVGTKGPKLPNPLLLANEVVPWLPDQTPGGGVAAPRLALARGTAAVAQPPAFAACASAPPESQPAFLLCAGATSSVGVCE